LAQGLKSVWIEKDTSEAQSIVVRVRLTPWIKSYTHTYTAHGSLKLQGEEGKWHIPVTF
jgi:hypothetical protein